jgi:hypothetical protein
MAEVALIFVMFRSNPKGFGVLVLEATQKGLGF